MWQEGLLKPWKKPAFPTMLNRHRASKREGGETLLTTRAQSAATRMLLCSDPLTSRGRRAPHRLSARRHRPSAEPSNRFAHSTLLFVRAREHASRARPPARGVASAAQPPQLGPRCARPTPTSPPARRALPCTRLSTPPTLARRSSRSGLLFVLSSPSASHSACLAHPRKPSSFVPLLPPVTHPGFLRSRSWLRSTCVPVCGSYLPLPLPGSGARQFPR